MFYCSTRAKKKTFYSSADVLLMGLAPDGGLFMPAELPVFTEDEIKSFFMMTYPQLAATILFKFFRHLSYEDLLQDAEAAYGYDHFPEDTVRVESVNSRICTLELWHGPTSAFKDMALQILPLLLSRTLQKTGEKRTAVILTATSGDTGKAALEGFRDVPGVKIKVYYPANGVSETQRLQMITQEGENVSVRGIKGNFDDAQSAVKMLFADKSVAKALRSERAFLSSANSINWGRLVPQIVYYVYAYVYMVKNGYISMGEKLDTVVPTGNFGDIFAAYLAKKMGLPLGKLVCASNKNRVLTDFFETGVYNVNRDFYMTISPSMDILMSSNLERLIYRLVGPEETARLMKKLQTEQSFSLTADQQSALGEDFLGICTAESECLATIRHAFIHDRYLMDPHTAVAFHAATEYAKRSDASRRILVVSTASPFKFSKDVLAALEKTQFSEEKSASEQLSKLTGEPIPAPLSGLELRPVRFEKTISPAKMTADLIEFLQESRRS